MPSFLRLEVVRMLRDPRYLALAVAAPIGFYLLFATLFGGGGGGPSRPGRLPGAVEIMVAMAVYGAVWAAVCTTGPRIAEERQSGWLTGLRAMPLPAAGVFAAKITAAVVTAGPAVMLVCATAVAVKDVRLGAGQWAALIAVTWVGTVPFAAMGIAIGFCVPAEAAFPLGYGVYMAMSGLGGLWVPPAVLPAGMLSVARWLPTYHLARLGWAIAGGPTAGAVDVVNLAAWTAGFAALAVVGYTRPRLRVRRRAGGRPVLKVET